jgi:hypothetical protein
MIERMKLHLIQLPPARRFRNQHYQLAISWP